MRAQKTLNIIYSRIYQNLDVIKDIALNERDYGNLIGKNKDEAAMEYGPEQIQIWRRSFSIPPPDGESLEMTAERTLPYFKKTIE